MRRRGRRVTTLLSTDASGTNEARGRSSNRRAVRRRADRRPPVSSRRTTSRCSTRSARVNDGADPSIDKTCAVTANGGLATTRNGRRVGKRKVRKSASTTTASRPARRRRRSAERRACSSTAMTRAPPSSSGRVSLPVPAPSSTTSSPGRTSAAVTISSAQCGSRQCQPHDGRPDTAHHEERDHNGDASPTPSE